MTPPNLSHSDAKLSISLLGAFQLQIEGEQVPIPRARAASWILALLILRRGGEIDRSWLAETLWPSAEKASALYNLRRNLTELRKMLGGEALRLSSPSPHSLRFDLSNAICDAVEFERLIQRSDSESLRTAVGLYQGELLEGCNEEWILPERIALERKYLGALESLAEFEAERGDRNKAIEWLKLMTIREPLREGAHRRLMETLCELGDFAGVERQYRELQKHLRNELNLDPTAETTALYQRLRLNARSPQVAAPHPSRAASSLAKADLRSLDNLPHPLTTLIGREQDRQELGGILSKTRMITLTGPGGVGKTRLAIALCQSVKSLYPDGVWFVDIAHLQQEEAIAHAVAAALNVRTESSTASEALTQFLQNRKSLLILDNCEQAAEACAKLASSLLHNCESLTLLSTSRQPLHVPGEKLWIVKPLRTPSDPQMKEEIGDYARRIHETESVALLLDRIHAVSPAYQITSRNAQDFALICRRLDGLPLALELAAVCFRSLSAQEIAGRLEDRFRLLISGNPENSRHKTLRAMLDWSYEQLSEAERNLLLSLSVFEGGCTLPSIEAISVSMPEESESQGVIEALSRLVDCSLVFFEDQTGTSRYFLLETVKVYCREKLALRPDDTLRLARTHAAYYLELAESVESHFEGADSGSWLTELDHENENLRAAISWSLAGEAPSDILIGVRLVSCLSPFWRLLGRLHEARGFLEIALQRIDANTATQETARIFLESANISEQLREVPRAYELFNSALEMYRSLGDKRQEAKTLHNLGASYANSNEYASARQAFEFGLSLSRENGNRVCEVLCLDSLGYLAREQGEFLESRDLIIQALSLCREIGDPHQEASLIGNLGYVFHALGDYAKAEEQFTKTLLLYRELGNRLREAWSMTSLGFLALEKEDFACAVNWLEQSLVINETAQNRSGIAWTLKTLGQTQVELNQTELARNSFDRALGLFRATGAYREEAHCLILLGNISRDVGEPLSACAFYRQAMILALQNNLNLLQTLLAEAVGELSSTFDPGFSISLLNSAESVRSQRKSSRSPLMQRKMNSLWERLGFATRGELGSKPNAKDLAQTLENALQVIENFRSAERVYVD